MRGHHLVVFLLITMALVGCAKSMENEYDKNVKNMHQIINDSYDSNEALAKSAASLDLPSAVETAMTPSGAKESSSHGNHEKRFDVSVSDVPAATFFAGLTADSDDSIVVSPNVEGSVTLDLKNVTLSEVMASVSEIYGYQYEKRSYGYNVYPKQIMTRIFYIDRLNIDRSGTSDVTLDSTNFVSSDGDPVSQSSTSVSTTFSDTFWDELTESLEVIIAEDGSEDGDGITSVKVNRNTGTVVVKAYAKQIANIEEFLANTQMISNREVIIEAQILDIALKSQFSSGIDWQFLGSESNDLLTLQPKTGLIGNVFTFGGSGSNGNISYFIHLLSSQGKVTVLSRPKVSVLNNQNAIIKVGTDEYFVVDVSSEVINDEFNGNTTSMDIGLDPFFSGISLDVTPQISDDGYITLHIHPRITLVEQQNKTMIVNGEDNELPLAKSTVRESDSVVRARSGQVVVIGGLMEDGMTINQSSPSLDSESMSDSKYLLTSNDNQGAKGELVILLKPIIANDGVWQSNLREYGDHIDNYKSIKPNG